MTLGLAVVVPLCYKVEVVGWLDKGHPNHAGGPVNK